MNFDDIEWGVLAEALAFGLASSPGAGAEFTKILRLAAESVDFVADLVDSAFATFE